MPPRHKPEGAVEIGAGEIAVHLDELLAARGMTLTELSDLVGITIVNLSVLKNGHARAIRFSTLAGICDALDCQPGDILTWQKPAG
jgi:putative transcriptional regulator